MKMSTRPACEMRFQGHLWQLCLFLSTFAFSSSASLLLDTFKDVKLSGCTCSFTMVLNDEGIVDAENAACNKKCSKKSIRAHLEGPDSNIGALYRIQMNVARGSVTVVRLSATFTGPSESTTPASEGTAGPPELTPPPPSPCQDFIPKVAPSATVL